MAKLSARGRKELFRLEREEENPEKTDRSTITYAFMSDGSVLQKLKVTRYPSEHEPKGSSHDFGWKKVSVKGKVQVDALQARLESRGYIRK